MEKTPTIAKTDPLSFFEKVKSICEPFRTSSGEPFISARVDGHIETMATKNKEFSLLIARFYYEQYGKVPSASLMKNTINMVEAEALFNGPERKVSVRVAEEDDAIFVDLANKQREQVKITAKGWTIIQAQHSPIFFVRSPRMVPMARPAENGSFEKLWDFINLEAEHDKVLALSWLLSTFQPNGPYPILNIQGEQGTGKSTLCKLFRELVDPAFPAITSLPKSERDLAISSFKSRVLAFDNISHISDWLSDAFCRLSTGGGFATRALYTDDAEAVFDIKMPLIVNGITELFTRHDLSDRAIFLTTKHIPKEKRMPEGIMKVKWKEAKPEIMGAIFDAVSTALKNKDSIKLELYPRMADFTHWVVSAEPALPWNKYTFINEYTNNRLKIIDNAIESDPVASSVQLLIKKNGNWSSTPTELLAALNTVTSEEVKRLKIWPKRANILSAKLRRCASFLRERSIEIEFSKSGQRNITIHTQELQNPEVKNQAAGI